MGILGEIQGIFFAWCAQRDFASARFARICRPAMPHSGINGFASSGHNVPYAVRFAYPSKLGAKRLGPSGAKQNTILFCQPDALTDCAPNHICEANIW